MKPEWYSMMPTLRNRQYIPGCHPWIHRKTVRVRQRQRKKKRGIHEKLSFRCHGLPSGYHWHRSSGDMLLAPEYLRWKAPEFRASHHGFLWIKGKPGAGKSTLMKHALRHEQSLERRDTTIISFFFNARGHELEKTTEGMYRSLVHQVYKAFPYRLPEDLVNRRTNWKDHVWELPELQRMLRDSLLHWDESIELICYVGFWTSVTKTPSDSQS